MSSTTFIAVQCCECSTMQVKQRKKSINKWSCAVCNQKQSLRKVFAQGFVAKDIRKFVQNFNMSRKAVDDGEWLLAGTRDPGAEEPITEKENGNDELKCMVNQIKKRSDWTLYLDQEDPHIIKGGGGEEEEELNGDDFEPQVVTELYKGMFKKPRLVEKENSYGLFTEGSNKLLKPFSPSSQEEPMKDQRRSLTKSNLEWDNYETPHNSRTQTCKPKISRTASKWNDYVTEDNDYLEHGGKRTFKGQSGPWNSSLLEAITSEQRVEDDIHPDFL